MSAKTYPTAPQG